MPHERPAPSTLLKEEPSLPRFTEGVRRNQAISWYRTPLTSAQVKSLHAKSNWRGAWQTLGYLGIVVGAGAITLYSAGHWRWWSTAGLFYAYASVAAFLINGVHELGHQTVFRTRWLNTFFCHVLAFLGWINHETFQSSHMRHHRYTLHPPDDLETVLPIKLVFRHLIRNGFVDPRRM